jgi:hypothetical protein
VGSVAAGFTTLCCLGLASVVSLTSAIGATFLQQDSTLRPLLVVTLGITVVGSALTFWRHRNPIPLLMTVVAGGWIYWFTFVAAGVAVGGGDTMESAAPAAGHEAGGHQGLVLAGLAVFLAAQVWDVVRVRACRKS